MDLETPKEDAPAQPTPTPLSQPKRPSQALYVPKQRLHGSKDKAQTQEGIKPRPRPRYTDKARKNATNKKATAADKATSVGGDDRGEIQDSDNKSDVKEEQLQDAEVPVNGHAESTSVEADASSRLETTSLQEEQDEGESWDTLFNDDGDCLDPHLLEEVRAWCLSVRSQKATITRTIIPTFTYSLPSYIM